MSVSNKKKLRRDTRVFISAVTRELGSVRKLVKKGLEDNDYHAVEQDNFPPDYRDLIDKLRARIATCDAVIHIAGHCYGAEPPQRPAAAPQRSYTQLEYDLARELDKPVYVFLSGAGFPADACEVEDDDLTQLQEAHRQQLAGAGLDYNPIKSREELDQKIRSLQLKVEALEDELRYVDTHVTVTGRRLSQRFAIGAALLIVLVGGIGWGVSQLRRKVPEKIEQVQKQTADQIEKAQQQTSQQVEATQERTVRALTDPAALAETIRKQIHATAEEKINALPNEQGRGRLITAIEQERDVALGRVDDLIKLIQEGLQAGASPVFQRATEILQTEGTDEALAYLESSRPSTLDLARRHAEQAKIAQARAEAEKEQRNKTLQALVLEAELLETKLQWQPALALREQVAELAPDWFEARTYLGMLLDQLARYGEAEPHKRAALALAVNPKEEAIALNNLATLLQVTNRIAEAEPLVRRALAIDEQSYGAENPKVAICLNNLATLLQVTNRMAEAEPLVRRALAIDEQSYGAEHPHVANSLSNLAALLYATNRLAEAEPLMRRALAIDEQSYGAENPEVAIHLNNLATLLNATNRLAEAEPLVRRALAIDEQSYGAEHPHVANSLNNLATLLQATNRLPKAEPLMRRVVTIFEKSLGEDHPNVAAALNNLGQLLQATNRLAEAEPLMRRALAIDEQSYGAEHPDVAIDLNNLAQLLKATNRLAEAKPLMRRPVEILRKFAQTTGHEHPRMQAALVNYGVTLLRMDLPEDEIAQRLKAAATISGPLTPIVPEVERLLGPAQLVADVLAALDRQYKAEGKPAVYFLAPDQPMAPHLVELFKPNPDSLNAACVRAYLNGEYAEAIVKYDELLKLVADNPGNAATMFNARMNRGAALRELGDVDQARDDLRLLLSGLDEGDSVSALSKGRAYYHLALCQWRLGDLEAARREAEESLQAYGEDAEAASLKEQTEQLLADLKDNKPLPPLAKVDTAAALESARVRFRARAELATLPLDQPSLPLLDQMLGPAESTEEVFETLDRQYREQGKPAVWFLPLTEPIAPHLDELLGPVQEVLRE